MPFTCPRCAMTSHHPRDEQEGYCGACHDWTGARELAVPEPAIARPWASLGDNREVLVPSGSARIAALGAVFLREPGLLPGIAAARRRLDEQVRERRLQRLLTEEPGADAMHWSPGAD